MSKENSAEPRPVGVRISDLTSEQRRIVADYRFHEIVALLKASGCAVTPDPKSHAVNFHDGDQLMIVRVDVENPRKISLMMGFFVKDVDLGKSRWACYEASAKQFSSKASITQTPRGYSLEFSVGVYAESLDSFADNIKPYADEIKKLYNDYVDIMILDR